MARTKESLSKPAPKRKREQPAAADKKFPESTLLDEDPAPAPAPAKKRQKKKAAKPKTSRAAAPAKRKMDYAFETCGACNLTRDSKYTALVTPGGSYLCMKCYIKRALKFVRNYDDKKLPYKLRAMNGPYYMPQQIVDQYVRMDF